MMIAYKDRKIVILDNVTTIEKHYCHDGEGGYFLNFYFNFASYDKVSITCFEFTSIIMLEKAYNKLLGSFSSQACSTSLNQSCLFPDD